MAKLTKEEMKDIVQRELPGYKLVEKGTQESADAHTTSGQVEDGTPAVKALRRKYFGAEEDAFSPASDSQDAGADQPANNPDDDTIVNIERENRPDPLDRGTRAKAVVISGEKKRIIGSQG